MNDLVALVVGAVVVVFYSYERFNRITDEASQQLQRLVTLLSPDKLRSRRVIVNAYLCYTAIFLLIYFFFCAYAELIPMLHGPDLAVGAKKLPTPAEASSSGSLAGTSVAGLQHAMLDLIGRPSTEPAIASSQTSKQTRYSIGIDPTTSLAVALMIVGLGPSFPMLQNFEVWLRNAAHRLVGIPTRVIAIRDALRQNSLGLETQIDIADRQDKLLIPLGDWKRMSHYHARVNNQLDAPDEFHENISLIFAITSWIFERNISLKNHNERIRFASMEEDLVRRKRVLIQSIDEQTGYRASAETPADIASLQSETTALANPTQIMSWDRLARDVDELADDICMLLALYVEHEIITAEPEQKALPAASNEHPNKRQRLLAKEKLNSFLKEQVGNQSTSLQSRSYTMPAVAWTFFVVSFIALIWSVYPGYYEQALQSGVPQNLFLRSANYFFTFFTGFTMPVIVALAIRNGAMQMHRWNNLWLTPWTAYVPKLLFALVLAWLISTLFIVGVAMWQAGLTARWTADNVAYFTTLQWLFAYNAPMPMRGTSLALLIIIFLDAHRATRTRYTPVLPRFASLYWAMLCGLIMAIIGGITRTLSSLGGAKFALVPRASLDDIDRGLIVYGMICTAIIGFCVIYCICEVISTPSRISSRSYNRPEKA